MFNFLLYADGTQLYLFFKLSFLEYRNQKVQIIQSCMKEIVNWMTLNKVKLNETKTELMGYLNINIKHIKKFYRSALTISAVQMLLEMLELA